MAVASYILDIALSELSPSSLLPALCSANDCTICPATVVTTWREEPSWTSPIATNKEKIKFLRENISCFYSTASL